MSEEITAGIKQFMIVILISAILYVVCATIMSMFGSYAFIGALIAMGLYATLGYFVLVRYAARFEYSLNNGRLRMTRYIGKRTREVEFLCTDIVRTLYGVKPSNFVKRPTNMHRSLIKTKSNLYIEYKDKEGKLCGVVIEPSQKLRNRIENEREKEYK